MKESKANKNNRLQTRAELIKRSRSSVARNSLPPETRGMFDELQEFKQGARQFIDFSKPSKP